MKQNTLNKREYVLETLFWAIIAYIWYNNLLFINIDGKTVLESNVLLIVMIGSAIFINCLSTMRWRRNTSSAITTIIIPFGLYAYITYGKYMPRIYKFIVLVAIGIGVLATVCIIAVRVQVRTKKRRIFIKARMLYLILRLVGAVASISFIICLFCRIFIGGALLSSSESATETYGDEFTIAENIDTVLLLQEDEWKRLSLDERMDVLQCICNIEGNYLGLSKGIHIYASELDEYILGYYNNSASTIQISIDLLEVGDPYETLDTVCHEMFHAAQHRYVEIYEGLDDSSKNSYFLYNASVYVDEFKNYKSGRKTDDIYEYYGQMCERDARSYAAMSVADYYQKISEYLDQNKQLITEK